MTTFLFAKVHPAEISEESLEALGFRAAARASDSTQRRRGPTRPRSAFETSRSALCSGRCRLRARKVKRYHDIAGDGGSRILEQVAEQRTRITDGLAGVRHLVAVGLR